MTTAEGTVRVAAQVTEPDSDQKGEPRVLVMGDIHGCYDALTTLAENMPLRDEDLLITVGDYVDRGPDSRRVLDWLIARKAMGALFPILGNHEEMMVNSDTDPGMYRGWLTCGGRETLESYGLKPRRRTKIRENIPPDHWSFLTEHCEDFCETETHFFVHANALPDVELKQQPGEVIRWARFNRSRPHLSGKILVCGHTPQRDGLPLNLGHAVCIDTGVYMPEGWLTCLEPATGKIWQAKQSGLFREGQLPEPREIDAA